MYAIRSYYDYLGTNEIKKMKLLKSVAIVMGNTADKKHLPLLEKIRITSYNVCYTKLLRGC